MSEKHLPFPQATPNDDGTLTVERFYINDEGDVVKLVQKLKETPIQDQINSLVAERRKWAKYGDEKNAPPGPQETTALEENIHLNLFPRSFRPNADEEVKEVAETQMAGSGLKCRTCGGNHFTKECPYKDRVSSVTTVLAEEQEGDLAEGHGGPGKYQPPGLRGMGARPGLDDRDDSATLRVSNLPEDIDERVLKHIFSNYGILSRAHVAKDRVTGLGRGYAFFSYETVSMAENARRNLNGKGIGHLLMRVDFAKR